MLYPMKGENIDRVTEDPADEAQMTFDEMMAHADQMGADGIISMRYDANEVMAGVNEVLAYGTAVVVERI